MSISCAGEPQQICHSPYPRTHSKQNRRDAQASGALLYYREKMLEQQRRWGDPFKYGIKQNRSTIDTFIQYNHEQGITRRRLADEEIFAHGILDS